jgi:hypothetical protein
MAEEKKLEFPVALYDYVLFYECGMPEWADKNAKFNIKGDGKLVEAINWNAGSYVNKNDRGGETLFGVTKKTWSDFAKLNMNAGKGYTSDLSSMGQKGWFDIVDYYWNAYGSANRASNYACACVIFQMAWGGFGKECAATCLKCLKENADIKDYNFHKGGNIFRKIADATHAYTDSSKSFIILRSAIMSHYYNLSGTDPTQAGFRMGWLKRVSIPFAPDGLYASTIEPGPDWGLTYNSTLADWDNTINLNKDRTDKQRRMIKILDWGISPESVATLSAEMYNSLAAYTPSSSVTNSGLYGASGGITSLGNYSNFQSVDIINQQTQNKDEILNTLINGAYTQVKPCTELITPDKKKGVKIKRED